MKSCRSLSFLSFLLGCLLVLSSCSGRYIHEEGYAMGTFLAVSAQTEQTAKEILPLASALENEISHRVEGSAIARLNAGEEVLLTDRTRDVLLLCLEIKEKTNGAFTPFMLPLTSLWHFDATPSLPDPSALAEAVAEVEQSSLSLSGNVAKVHGKIDLGAVGKGMAAEYMAQALREAGESGLVSVGGSIAAVGKKNGEGWRVGVRDPFDSAKTLGALSLSDACVSTSGSYEKNFTEGEAFYHHILDASTGMPVYNDLVSVTVVADGGALSDILSTAAFVLGMEAGRALCESYGAEVLFVTSDGTLYATEGFLALFTPAEEWEVLPL